MSTKSKVEELFIRSATHSIPARVVRERRNNVRFSITRTGATIRLPAGLDASGRNEQLESFRQWIWAQLASIPFYHRYFLQERYRHGDLLTVGSHSFRLHLHYNSGKASNKAIRTGTEIYLSIANGPDDPGNTAAIRQLLSRIVANRFLPDITRRVMELNQLYFRQPVRQVRLKYNRSNWGSCSSKGTVNLSTCLLFAPPAAIDYVIIHELAHLLEMSHNKRFWDLVGQAMPDYPAAEKWLRENWSDCDF
ncbi:MAG: hypothetical protein RLY31_1303 [Bacteroidota bacterium]